jgi:hypothetical protein
VPRTGGRAKARASKGESPSASHAEAPPLWQRERG